MRQIRRNKTWRAAYSRCWKEKQECKKWWNVKTHVSPALGLQGYSGATQEQVKPFAARVAGEANVPFFSISGLIRLREGLGRSRLLTYLKTRKVWYLYPVKSILGWVRQRGAGMGVTRRTWTNDKQLLVRNGRVQGIIVIAINQNWIYNPTTLSCWPILK